MRQHCRGVYFGKGEPDRLLEEWDTLYPEYGFAKHKGYGTKAHYDAILRHGVLPIHRKSFLKNLGEKQP